MSFTPHAYGNAAWRIEASTLPDMSFQAYRDAIIYETPQIRQFLSDPRSDQFIIAGPKGFGKTLLLIAKRKQLEERDRSTSDHIIGQNDRPLQTSASGGEIVDRPTGVFPFLPKERIALLKSDYQHWKNLWKISIAAASVKTALKAHRHETFDEGDNTHPIISRFTSPESEFQSAATMFTFLVECDHRTQIGVVSKAGSLFRRFSSIRNQIALFIDNVDEYFKPVLEDHSVDLLNNRIDSPQDEHYRNKSNDLWVIAQAGLAGAAHELHKTNSHVKIYCTIRREALIRLNDYDDQYQQILGNTIEIEYSKAEYLEIFKKNVRLMDKSLLFQAGSDDEVAQFFGPNNTLIRHRFVDRAEGAFDYLLRHTFYRPRDLMILGKAISNISVKERSHEAIKRAVDTSTDDLVRGLVREMAPFFGLPNFDRLLKHVRSNALTMRDLSNITSAYLRDIDITADAINRDEHRHPFCVLHKIGALGHIQPEFDKEMTNRQIFVKPRNISIGNDVGLPITEDFYLIHPALDNYITRQAGRKYLKNFHSYNIVGNDLIWTERYPSYYVIKGDVCGFSGIMDSEYYADVSSRIHDWARATCSEIAYFEVSGGDSVLFIDRSPERVVRSATEFLLRARQYKGGALTLRFGGAAGPLSFATALRRVDETWEEGIYPLGLALRTSARLEPHALKGQIIVEDQFANHIESGSGNLKLRELSTDELPRLSRNPEGKFIIQKNKDDPPYETRLWEISLIQ